MDHSSRSWEITLLYFFSWNCTWFGQKEPIKVQDFRLLIAHIKLHQICTLIESFCWKYIKKFAIKVQRSYVSLPWRLMQTLAKNWSVVSKMTRIWWFLSRALESIKNLHFHWFLLCKVFNVWLKKTQRSYFSWHGRVTQYLKKNGLGNNMKNMANFHQSNWKCQNWDFDGILQSKVEKVWG